MESIKKLQDILIKKTRRAHEISPAIIEAFYKYPRHEFVPSRYSLTEAYNDGALGLYRERERRSTISQPSFVLYLLELLHIERNQKVFEVGTGSGWNAALISSLVGDKGKVVTMEIIPELAEAAKETLLRLGVKNVVVIPKDAGHGWAPEAPYDRIIFTAAAPQLPSFVAAQIKPKGRVLFVQEGEEGTDEVQLLEKTPEGFKCLQKLPCYFVPMTGSAKDTPSINP